MGSMGINWAPDPIGRPVVKSRVLDRVTIPVSGEQHEYKVRYSGQKGFFRATRAQAEQVVAMGLGEVQVDTVVEVEVMRLVESQSVPE